MCRQDNYYMGVSCCANDLSLLSLILYMYRAPRNVKTCEQYANDHANNLF